MGKLLHADKPREGKGDTVITVRQRAWVGVLTLVASTSMTESKFLNFSVPLCSRL